jgi:hypothetical protein
MNDGDRNVESFDFVMRRGLFFTETERQEP